MKQRLEVNTSNIYHRPVYHGLKRLLDVILSTAFLLLFWWLYVIIAIAIKNDDPNSPIFYLQTRVGQNGRCFRIYKFRSMVPDADREKPALLKYNDMDSVMFKMHDDPRVTKVGHFIRRHSLDELPQLVNVLEGDMTLVGPRPPLLNEVKHYNDYDCQRLLVTPGCTGLWQVSGRNGLTFHQTVNLDLEYINHSNLWFDTEIILKTLEVMVVPNGV